MYKIHSKLVFFLKKQSNPCSARELHCLIFFKWTVHHNALFMLITLFTIQIYVHFFFNQTIMTAFLIKYSRNYIAKRDLKKPYSVSFVSYKKALHASTRNNLIDIGSIGKCTQRWRRKNKIIYIYIYIIIYLSI